MLSHSNYRIISIVSLFLGGGGTPYISVLFCRKIIISVTDAVKTHILVLVQMELSTAFSTRIITYRHQLPLVLSMKEDHSQ